MTPSPGDTWWVTSWFKTWDSSLIVLNLGTEHISVFLVAEAGHYITWKFLLEKTRREKKMTLICRKERKYRVLKKFKTLVPIFLKPNVLVRSQHSYHTSSFLLSLAWVQLLALDSKCPAYGLSRATPWQKKKNKRPLVTGLKTNKVRI